VFGDLFPSVKNFPEENKLTASSLSDLENSTLTNGVHSIFIFREGVLMV
jgi:hypothetical protein